MEAVHRYETLVCALVVDGMRVLADWEVCVKSRRDLLKLFGVGAAIVPLIGGVPEVSEAAELITLPSIKPIEVVPFVDPIRLAQEALHNRGTFKMTVTFQDEAGKRFQFNADTFITDFGYQPIEVTELYRDHYRHYIPGPVRAEWQLKGRLIAQSGTVTVTSL